MENRELERFESELVTKRVEADKLNQAIRKLHSDHQAAVIKLNEVLKRELLKVEGDLARAEGRITELERKIDQHKRLHPADRR